METNAYSVLRRDVDELDHIIRGDGNGKPGLSARVRALEARDPEVRRVIQEWDAAKAEMRGMKKAAIIVGVILTALGGGLGAAILSAISKVATAIL